MMQKITIGAAVYGPFVQVWTQADRYLCTTPQGPVELQFSVVGMGIVEPWTAADVPAPDLVPIRADLVAAIDADVDDIYRLAIGARQAEYEEAERQAHAFAQGGYAGTVPGMVSSWATAKGWTAEEAADDILQQAATWRGAQDAIRAARLLRKEQARAAQTAQALATVRAAWAAFVALVRGQLGLGAA